MIQRKSPINQIVCLLDGLPETSQPIDKLSQVETARQVTEGSIRGVTASRRPVLPAAHAQSASGQVTWKELV